MKNDALEDASHLGTIWMERHYSPLQLGELWGMSHDSIIRLVKDEPGVLRLCPPHRRGARRRVTYRIPESVAKRIHERCSRR